MFSRENETLESFLLTKGAKIKEKKKQRYREREGEREREREVDEACPRLAVIGTTTHLRLSPTHFTFHYYFLYCALASSQPRNEARLPLLTSLRELRKLAILASSFPPISL